MRTTRVLVPKGSRADGGGDHPSVFAQPEAASAQERWRRVADGFRDRFPRLADLFDAAARDVLASMPVPSSRGRQIGSNPRLEQMTKETKRRTAGIGLPPAPTAVPRLVGMVLAEPHDAWLVIRRSFSAKSLAKPTQPAEPEPALLTAESRDGAGHTAADFHTGRDLYLAFPRGEGRSPLLLTAHCSARGTRHSVQDPRLQAQPQRLVCRGTAPCGGVQGTHARPIGQKFVDSPTTPWLRAAAHGHRRCHQTGVPLVDQ